MTITGLGTRTQTSGMQALATASHQQRNRTTTGATGATGATGTDSLSLSPEALAALRQSLAQGQDEGGRPPMTDEMAAKIGADIQSQNAELFKALDTDGTGMLTAAKLEAGKDKVDQAVQDGTMKLPEKKPDDGQGQPPADAPGQATAGNQGEGDAQSAKGAAMRSAGAAKGGGAKTSSSSSDSTTQQVTTLHNQGLSAKEIAEKLGITLARVQKALSSAS